LESSFWVLNSDYFKRRGFYDLTKFNLNESNLILDYFVDIHFQNIYSHEVFLKRVFEKNYYRLIMTDTWYPNQKNIKRKLCFIKKFSYIEEIPLNIDIGSDENFFYIESKKKGFFDNYRKSNLDYNGIAKDYLLNWYTLDLNAINNLLYENKEEYLYKYNKNMFLYNKYKTDILQYNTNLILRY
jgi:hypothetical protein